MRSSGLFRTLWRCESFLLVLPCTHLVSVPDFMGQLVQFTKEVLVLCMDILWLLAAYAVVDGVIVKYFPWINHN